MIIALWILTMLGLALWSGLAWGCHRLLTLDPAHLDALKTLAERLPHGEWIERWVPGWRELLALLVDATQAVLGWVGPVAPWIVWGVWGLGAAVLLTVATLLTLAIRSATMLPLRPPATGR